MVDYTSFEVSTLQLSTLIYDNIADLMFTDKSAFGSE